MDRVWRSRRPRATARSGAVVDGDARRARRRRRAGLVDGAGVGVGAALIELGRAAPTRRGAVAAVAHAPLDAELALAAVLVGAAVVLLAPTASFGADADRVRAVCIRRAAVAAYARYPDPRGDRLAVPTGALGAVRCVRAGVFEAVAAARVLALHQGTLARGRDRRQPVRTTRVRGEQAVVVDRSRWLTLAGPGHYADEDSDAEGGDEKSPSRGYSGAPSQRALWALGLTSGRATVHDGDAGAVASDGPLHGCGALAPAVWRPPSSLNGRSVRPRRVRLAPHPRSVSGRSERDSVHG